MRLCGIFGFNWKDENLLQQMSRRLSHRGPDDSGSYLEDNISLGHRRLSIIDLSDKGHQPMVDESGNFVIIFNGEVYNYQELRLELEGIGYDFQSNTDTETVLNSYREWGKECVERFTGMFSFVILDIREGTLFLARDHMGIKPLYYYHDDTRFIFSSTIPPLLLHDIPTRSNSKVIRDFLLYNTTDHLDETFFENIMCFPKGKRAFYDVRSNELRIEKWWSIQRNVVYDGEYQDAVNLLRSLLERSVNARLMSDVAVGTCLSGGIDSSTIACLIQNSRKAEISTFSVVYPGFERDESRFVEIAIRETGMENHMISPSVHDIRNDLSMFIRSMGEPVATTSPFSQFFVFKLAREHDVTVLLDGQGADELLAGYHYFFGFFLKGLLRRFRFTQFMKEIWAMIQGGSWKFGLKSLLFLLAPGSIQKLYFRKRSNISKSLHESQYLETSFFKDHYSPSDLHNALDYHMGSKLEQVLKWEDRNSMIHSCEARVPFLDKQVIDLIFTLPDHFIISSGRTKSILRDAMEGIVPDEILDRRDKIGFDTPEDEWLRTEPISMLLKDWFVSHEPLCCNYIDMSKTRKMISRHLSGKNGHGSTLWKSIFLEAWFKEFIKESTGIGG